MLANLFGKYKTLVVSIALFLLLDATVLVMNFYTSFQIAADAKTVNLAGRQRMLSQRMVKNLYEMEQSVVQGQPYQGFSEELMQSVQMFDVTLQALDIGGAVPGSLGASEFLAPIPQGPGREALTNAKVVWKEFAQRLKPLVDKTNTENKTAALGAAVLFARANNARVLNLMNAMTQELERNATAKASQLRTIQLVAIVLAVINFILILRHFLGHLRRSDLALEAARQETQNILDTVNEGLFLLDNNLRMGSEHSAKLTEMFSGSGHEGNIENCLFSDFLRDRIKPTDLETAQRFIGLLFRKNIKSNLIGDLNPLKKVEINIAEEEGGYVTKYMHFDFRRVLAEGDIKQILVTVKDITTEVLLSRQLDESKAENAQQIEMLTGILHANPDVLKQFIQNAMDGFKRVNDLFRVQDKTPAAMQRKLREVFVEVHNFKAEAASLSLSTLVGLAHEMETAIKQLIDHPHLTGTDLLVPVVQLEKLITYTESVQALAQKVASLSCAVQAVERRKPARWQHLQELAAVLAQRHDKKVSVHLTGFNEIDMSEEQARIINDMCLQFIRNAIIHGIEKPEFRRLCNKPETGRVDLSLIQMEDGGLEINVRDDGGGVDYEKIRNQAVAMGLAKTSDLAKWNQKQIIGLMFKPGFSTAAELTDDAGRGVGMDVIVSRVQRMKGNIKVASKRGKNCQFIVTLPNTGVDNVVAA